MCSHESIAWEITDNSVTDRMIDNSLIHKFRPSRKIRRRTKVLNAEIKRHYVKDYKHYVDLKTNVLRNLTSDIDTGDNSSLTDVDYDIIYSSPSKQAKYVAENSERYIFTSEEDCKGCKRKNVTCQIKSRGKSTERKVQTRKFPRIKYTMVSKKYIDVGWQEIIKENSSMHKQVCANISDNEGNILKDNDCNNVEAQSSKQSLSPRFDSRNNTPSKIVKYESEYMRQNHEESNAMDNKLSSENSTISNETKPVSERKTENYENQSAAMNESNIKFNSHGLHYQLSPSQSTSLENGNDFDNESNTLIKSKDNSNKLTSNKSSINTKNYDDTCVNLKSELLKNVRRNLIPALEKADTTNNDKDIETEKNVEDTLNYDQLLPATISFNQHSTPLRKTQTNIPKIKDLLPDTSSQDQQKDSGIDEDSQDKLIKIKESNKITSRNMEENAEKIPIFSPELKKNDEVIEIAEDYKEDEKNAYLKFSNNILEDQRSKEEKELSGEEQMKNSFQSDQIDVEITQEDKEHEHFAKIEDLNHIQKQQLLSPKQDCMKDTHSEPCNHIQGKEDDRKIKKFFEEEEISLQLNKVNKDIEVSSINCEDKTHLIGLEDLCDIQKQLFPKKSHIKDIHPKSYNNILGEDKRQASEETEKNNFPQLNYKDEKNEDKQMYLTNQEDKTCIKLDDTHDVQKQLVLPKVMYTEILNKRYKIIDKKKNDVKRNIEAIDNNNMDIANEYTPTKKNTLIHCSDVIDHNTDNWQETTINAEEIDAPIALETDNEDINENYVSPQTKKRLQQQARLNLVVNSDSSENDEEYVTSKTSRKYIDSSDMSDEDRLKNDETNCASEQTDISHDEDIYIPKEATLVSTEVIKLDSTNMKERIKKKAESLRYTYESNDFFQSTNENPLNETQYCENVHNDDQSKDNSFQLRVSESNISCNNKESINQFRRHKQSSLLNKKNMYSKNNENEEITRTEFETRYNSEHEQRTLTKSCSNINFNIFCQYRPCNLQELIENQELVVETMPASFTLADLSEDEEAFILNVPSKVVQCNLQGQVLTLKEKSIKFNESKYRILCKEVGTTSCIFATGKKEKPYKIINIKKISTITLQEKLPQDSKKTDISNYSTVSSVPKQIKISKTDETDLKMLNISNYKKRKRRESSGSETGYLLDEERTIKNLFD